MSDLTAQLTCWWHQQQLPVPSPGSRIGVAFSAGVDSTVLLHAAKMCWPTSVTAIHINHRLQPEAWQFEAQAKAFCQRWDIPLHVVSVDVACRPGDSLEEQARMSRYAALAQTAARCDLTAVCLAQHADDQVETVLLALTRGAGLPGLAAMPPIATRLGVRFVRPFLGIRKAALECYAQQHGLDHVVDPMNGDTTLTRNRLRHLVLPALNRYFPAVADTVARSARHCAQAAELLAEYADADLRQIGQPPTIGGLQGLSLPRQVNALRRWLQQEAGQAPTEAQMKELVRQVAAATTRSQQINIRVCNGRVLRQGAVLEYKAII